MTNSSPCDPSTRISNRLLQLVRWRWALASAAAGCTVAGALLLTYFTRRAGGGPLQGSTIVAIFSLALLLVGVALGGAWLEVELSNERRAGSDVPPEPATITHGVPEPRRSQRSVHKIALAWAILLGASAGVMMGQMGDLLLGFHQPGEVSANHAALQGLGNPLQRDRQIDQALLTWSRFARPGLHAEDEEAVVEPQVGPTFREDRNAPITALAWFFGLDSGLFVMAYFTIFGLVSVLATRSLYARRTSISRTGNAEPDGFLRMARWAAIFAVVAAFADQVENWTGLTSTTSAWFSGELVVADMSVNRWMATVLGLATLVKTLFFAATFLSLIFIGMFLLRNGAASDQPWSGVRSTWQSVLAVRIQIIAVILFAVLMSFRIQASDTFLRWGDNWWVGALASGLVVLMALAIWHSGRWLMTLASETEREGSHQLGWWLLAIVGVALLTFGIWAGWAVSLGLVVPLVIILFLWLISLVAPHVPTRGPLPPGLGSVILPRLLGASVLAFFGLAIIKASSGQLIYQWMGGYELSDLVALVIVGALFVFGSMAMFALVSRAPSGHPFPRATRDPAGDMRSAPSRWTPSLWLLVSVVAWMIFATILDQSIFSLGPALGIAGVMAVFILLLTSTLSSAVAVADSVAERPAPVFRAAGLRRTPILSLIILWALVVSLVPLGLPHAPATVTERSTGVPAGGETLEEAFVDWVDDNCLSASAPISNTSVGARPMPVVPLVLVSSSGGGVRAAVWTSLVMDKVFGFTDPDTTCAPPELPGDAVSNRSRWLFAASGISGGSLGFLTYVAQLTEGPPSTAAEARIQEHLGDDSLAPTLAWMLLVETPWSLLRFGVDRDRGDIILQSWERQWPEGQPGLRQNFVDLRVRHDDVPLLLLNGASAESGCRFNGSMLNANGRDRSDAVLGCLEPQGLEGSPDATLPATIDLVDFLCEGQVISLAKAALFSARFPVILPVGTVQQCNPSAGGTAGVSDPQPETFVVDGGYLEGSGTATALDIWNALAPMVTDYNLDPNASACVVPFFVQIDNSYLEPAGPGDTKAPPALVGLQEYSASQRNRNGFTTAARQSAQIAFGKSFTLGGLNVRRPDGTELEDRYVRFSPVAHPGAVAPLGWTLSETAFRDLFDQFDKNRTSLAEVDSWFAGMTCTVAPRSR